MSVLVLVVPEAHCLLPYLPSNLRSKRRRACLSPTASLVPCPLWFPLSEDSYMLVTIGLFEFNYLFRRTKIGEEKQCDFMTSWLPWGVLKKWLVKKTTDIKAHHAILGIEWSRVPSEGMMRKLGSSSLVALGLLLGAHKEWKGLKGRVHASQTAVRQHKILCIMGSYYILTGLMDKIFPKYPKISQFRSLPCLL